MQSQLEMFINEIPKSDLHIHLDGSLRINTLIDLSKKQDFPLPSYTESGLNELVFKDHHENLVEYLKAFNYTVPVLQTPENLERVSYELAEDSIADNVYYIEVRFAPQFHVNKNQNIDEVLLSVNRGLNKAKQEYNQRSEVKNKKLPHFNYGIIVCGMKYFPNGYSEYLDQMIIAHRNLGIKKISSIAATELVKSCVRIRDEYNLPIVAIDLAGEEIGNPPINYKEAYYLAHKNFMRTTVHVGESNGPENIHEAITELYPERIGHGYHLFSKNWIENPYIRDRDKYIETLAQHAAQKRITFEVCLTSNLQTNPDLKDLKDHSFAKMIDANLSIAICTDNLTVGKTNLTKELVLAINNFNLSSERIKHLVLNSFRKSFYPGIYKEKINYIKQINARYDFLAKQYTNIF